MNLKVFQKIHDTLLRIRGTHPSLMALPEDAILALALHEFEDDSGGAGDLALLAKNSRVVIQAAVKSGILEPSPSEEDLAPLISAIPLMAKLLQDVTPPKNGGGATPQKEKMVATPEGVTLDPGFAVLTAYQGGRDNLSAKDVIEVFHERGWTMGVKRIDVPILATLRSSDYFKCVRKNPERFVLTDKGQRKLESHPNPPRGCRSVDPTENDDDLFENDDDLFGLDRRSSSEDNAPLSE